jgi:hypothetical protein
MPRARTGNAKLVRAMGGDWPRVDAVEVWATLDWLKGDTVGVATMSPREARVLAIQLLTAANEIEDRFDREAIESRRRG